MVGKLQALCLALHYGRFELVDLYHCLHGSVRRGRVKLSHRAIHSLREYWLELSKADMGRAWGPPAETVVLFSDASKSGWGVHSADDPGVGGYFSLLQSLSSIDKLEM